MKISVLDGSHYFKGLLLLIRKDHVINETEIALMKRIGKSLGFEKDFCDQAINDILQNEHIEDVPSVFSVRTVAEKFIRDGLRLSFSDGKLHPAEEEWLQKTASVNGLDDKWFWEQRTLAARKHFSTDRMEAEDLKIEHL